MSQKTLPAQIIDAIKGEDCEAIRKIFESNPEQRTVHTFIGGQTWLGYACQLGKLNAAQALVQVGSDVDAGDKRDGAGPICSAADNGHYELVEYLLRCGAKLDVSTSARNPLFAAIIGRSVRIVRLLLEAGIDSGARYRSETMKDMDAVAFALMRGEKECAEAIALWNANGDEEIAKAALVEANRIAELNAK